MSDVHTTGLEHDVAMLEQVAAIARELATARNVDETLQRVVELGQNYVPGCEAASLSIIHDRDATIGALNMLSTRADAFGDESRLFGEVFASHAAIAMRAAFTEAGLEQALATRELVTQAKGILMEREGLGSREAFDRLVSLAEKRRTTLREVALQLTDAAADA